MSSFFAFWGLKNKWGLSIADTTLVHVSKPRFGSKYSGVLRSPHKLKFAGSPIGSEARGRETKTSPSGHPACGLERCQLDTCNTKKKRQSRVRIQFLAAGARLFLSRKGNDYFLSRFARTIVSNETDEERTYLLGGGAGRSPIY